MTLPNESTQDMPTRRYRCPELARLLLEADQQSEPVHRVRVRFVLSEDIVDPDGAAQDKDRPAPLDRGADG